MSIGMTASTSKIFSTAHTHERQLFTHPTSQGLPRAARDRGAREAMRSHVNTVSPPSMRVRETGFILQWT